MIASYTHDGCPHCGSMHARHFGEGRFVCRRATCYREFRGHRKPRKSLPRVNRRRAKRRNAVQFGDLATYVRTLPCLVEGCDSHRIVAAHVHTRGAGHGAWIVGLDGEHRGNLVPLCRRHHDAQHLAGVPDFERAHRLAICTHSARTRVDSLEHAGVLIGVLATQFGLGPAVEDAA